MTEHCEISQLPVVLRVPIIKACNGGDSLCIGVEVLTGNFVVSSDFISLANRKRLQNCLNAPSKPGLPDILVEIRYEANQHC